MTDESRGKTSVELEATAESVLHELEEVQAQIFTLKERERVLKERVNELQHAARIAAAHERVAGLDFGAIGTFSWESHIMELAKNIFGVTQFRQNQREAINCLLSGHDCFVVMPTGGGKSLIYVLSAISGVRGNVSVVVSPLISLMQDQATALEDRGVHVLVYQSGLAPEMASSIMKELDSACSRDDSIATTPYQVLLYVTPEMLVSSKRLQTRLQHVAEAKQLALFAIDEAHCCSQWGHDFRSDYSKLGVIRALFPDIPIAALTATATTRVIDDVCDILSITGCPVFRSSFNRPNIRYELIPKAQKPKDAFVQLSQLILTRFRGLSGIVYCFSRKDAEVVSDSLNKQGLKSVPYHSGMDTSQRATLQRAWTTGRVLIIVATVAFGLGIDKSDVRFVIHFTMPKSIESYYQESGRAGRDGKDAVSILMFSPLDEAKVTSLVCSTRGGLRALEGATRYCLNHSQCRRLMLSAHFGETLNPTVDCAGHCDICNPDESSSIHQPKYVVQDVRDIARVCVEVLEASEQRMTYIMLDDAVVANSRSSGLFPKSWTRNDRLEIYLHLKLLGILKEELSATAYSVLIYVTVGPVRVGSKSISISVPVSEKQQEVSRKQPKRMQRNGKKEEDGDKFDGFEGGIEPLAKKPNQQNPEIIEIDD